VLLTLIALAPLFSELPKAVLGAVIIGVACARFSRPRACGSRSTPACKAVEAETAEVSVAP
jgi:hypothetical protein